MRPLHDPRLAFGFIVVQVFSFYRFMLKKLKVQRFNAYLIFYLDRTGRVSGSGFFKSDLRSGLVLIIVPQV